MDEQILDNFEVGNVDPSENDITKINTTATIRGIDGNSLHFISVPRDTEFIDHVNMTLLNPEYITHLPNGFIVDFLPTNETNDAQPSQFIGETINNDIVFQNDEQDRKLTAAFLQLVNKQCPVKLGNEAQVIVSHKDMATLTPINEVTKDEPFEHNILSIDDQHTITQTLITDNQFKLYSQPNLPQMQINSSLPPLTPIRRLNRPRKSSNVNIQSPSRKEMEISTLKTIEAGPQEEFENHRPLAKKSLPHKKRITKKLKTIDKTEPQQRQTVIFQDIQEVKEDQINAIVNQFACQLCGLVSDTQLNFFSHLKSHYEPIPDASSSNCKTEKDINPDQNLSDSNNQFCRFNDDGIKQEKTVDSSDLNNKIVIDQDSHNSVENKPNLIDEIEFSDPEDMLEGIRGVVDKVQESVGNDSNDGMDIISDKNWYSNSALNGNIHFKTDGHPANNQNGNATVDFTLFFKNNMDKSIEQQEENILSTHSEDISKENTSGTVSCASFIVTKNDEEITKAKGRTQRSCARKSKVKEVDSDEFFERDSFDEESSDTGEKSKRKKKIKCKKCDKLFNSANALKYHDLSHTGERPHQCEICGKSFFALSALKVHIRLHSGEKPYLCEICQRPFRQWGDLKYHTISIHTNEKNFQCEFCGKAFARRYSLVIHRRIHTSERNYKCEFCPKSFRASSYLQNHRKVHTGEKPYACKICGKKFRVSGDLKRHFNIHGREKRKPKQLILSSQVLPSISPSTQNVKTEKAQIDLNIIQEQLIVRQSVKAEQQNQPTNVIGSDSIMYSDGAIDIFKNEPEIDNTY